MKTATFVREDGKAAATGFWHHRGGCLYLGEITVAHNGKVMRFSSTSPMSEQGLSGYTTDEYLARFAARFR